MTDPGDVMFCPNKSLHESCRMCRRIVVMKLICSLGNCECDGHTVHQLSQRLLTADWLAPRESDCSRMHSNVSSDFLHDQTQQQRCHILKLTKYYFDVCTVHFVKFITHIYKCTTIYIYIYQHSFYIVNIATWFYASASSSGILNIVLC